MAIVTLEMTALGAPAGGGSSALTGLLSEQALGALFSPLQARGVWGNRPFSVERESGARWHQAPLWEGETLAEDAPLSRLTPEAAVSGAAWLLHAVTEAVRALLKADDAHPEEFQISMTGALFHTPPLPDARPGWYGRVVYETPERDDGRLWELVRVRIDWLETRRLLWIDFPLDGYPLTSVTPLYGRFEHARGAVEREAAPLLRACGARFRERLASSLRPAASLLGEDPRHVYWEIACEPGISEADRTVLSAWVASLQATRDAQR